MKDQFYFSEPFPLDLGEEELKVIEGGLLKLVICQIKGKFFQVRAKGLLEHSGESFVAYMQHHEAHPQGPEVELGKIAG